MKLFSRPSLWLVALGLLAFSGCVSDREARFRRMPADADFEVVESSTNEELTPAQEGELRTAVANYLESEGLAADRLYYVKVQISPKEPDDQPEWAVVRIGGIPSRTYTVLASYAGPDDYYPYDYYRYGYPDAYYGFSRFGYYDPFDFNYGYYSRPHPVYPVHGHRPGHRPGHHHGRPDPNNPGDGKDDKPSQPPPPHRWEDRPKPTQQGRPQVYPRIVDPRRGGRDPVNRFPVPNSTGGSRFPERTERTRPPSIERTRPERSVPQPSRMAPARSYAPPPRVVEPASRPDSSSRDDRDRPAPRSTVDR